MEIIVIDDDGVTRDVLAAILAEEGHKVKTAANGTEGLALIHRQPPDLILCDEVMPDVRGHQICQRLQADPYLASIPIILISGHSHDIIPGTSNVVLFLRKPIAHQELLNTVDDVLGG